jgi:hypothetical protein
MALGTLLKWGLCSIRGNPRQIRREMVEAEAIPYFPKKCPGACG